jgi:hypothetical protein
MTSSRLLLTTALAGALLAVGSARAGVLYDNGPSTYQAGSYSITGGNYAADSFMIGTNATVTGVDFAVWNSPTYATTTTIDWAIVSGLRAPYGAFGTVIASGTSPVTSSYILTNTSGYAVNADTFAIAPTNLVSGLYSLYLFNASDTYGGGNGTRWDVNGGPATALVHTNFGPFEGYQASNTFQILGSVAGGIPEPATWAMMMVGLGGVGALARRRRSATVAA